MDTGHVVTIDPPESPPPPPVVVVEKPAEIQRESKRRKTSSVTSPKKSDQPDWIIVCDKLPTKYRGAVIGDFTDTKQLKGPWSDKHWRQLPTGQGKYQIQQANSKQLYVTSQQDGLYRQGLLMPTMPNATIHRILKMVLRDIYTGALERYGHHVKFKHQDDVQNPQEQTSRDLEAEFRYTHLSSEEMDLLDGLFRGKLQLDELPGRKSKVVKLFISSTFTDMQEERNALVENVYPRLRQYCRDQYGMDFQAVDMRWGVPPEAMDDHSASDMCMDELKHCQQLSFGPNFVALIGQKYGQCPLPAAVQKTDFDAILLSFEEQNESSKLLTTCYLRDQNTIPSMYRLQHASVVVEILGKPWNEVEEQLRLILHMGARRAVERAEMTRESERILRASVTEHEIYAGVITVHKEKDRENNIVVYLREIEDLKENTADSLAKRYIDLYPDSADVNIEASASLQELKGKTISKLPIFNIRKSVIKWSSKGIDSKLHAGYLLKMCNHFYRTVESLVDRNMARRNKLADDSLFHEVSQHWSVAKGRCNTFVGRNELLQTVREYLLGESNQALVVYGESGSGKTSFMAKASSLVNSNITKSPRGDINLAIVLRFIGTTPRSSSIQQLLHSISHQIAYLTGSYRHKVPDDYTSLKAYFIDLLQKGTFNGMLVIFLDGLDQLSTNNGAHTMDWLPSRLASNVKVIVSTLPVKAAILERLQSKISDNYIEVTSLPFSDCLHIMKVLLELTDRDISYSQWKLVKEAFEHCTLPLFITLTFQEVIQWRSYDDIPHDTLMHTVEACIHKLFDRLERKHGKVFVSRALGYITAAKNGLSESELEDIMSLDDDVLNSVFTLWEPPIRRIPPSLWSRLYLEISSFLVEREADGIVVLSWYHMQFVIAAVERYLEKDDEFHKIHWIISEYYLGTWSGTEKKPFKYTTKLMNRLKRTSPESAACRYVPEQPLLLRKTGVSERYNSRKLSQLPYSLINSGQFGLVKSHCFCKFEWIYTKLKATSLQQIIADFTLFEDRETELVADALRMSGSALKLDPNCLGPEICGRLLPHVSKYPIIRNLVHQCDLISQSHCPLVPNCQIYSAPGGPLQYECEIDNEIKSAVDVDVFQNPDGILMTAKPFYSTCLKVWELTRGEIRQDMQMPTGQVHHSKDGRYLCIFTKNKCVTVYKTDCSEVYANVNYGYGVVLHVNISKQYLAFTTDRGVGPIVIDLEMGKVLHKFSFYAHTVAISPNESFLAFNSGRSVLLYSLPLMERKCVGQTSDDPVQIIFTSKAAKCFVLTQTKFLESVQFDVTNRVSKTHGVIHDLEIKEFTLSHTEKYILVRSLRCLYIIGTMHQNIIHRIQQMPPGTFTETMSTFSGAGFTPKDVMVVASRYTYIAVWNTETGEPVRLLQASVSPIVKLFTSNVLNKAVSFLQDNILQVWNLDNLDADIQHANEVIKGPVLSLDISTRSSKIICSGNKIADAKILNTANGTVIATLQHSCELGDYITDVRLSPLGRYAVTKAVISDRGEDAIIGCKFLTDDIIWDMKTLKKIYQVKACRYVSFNESSSLICITEILFYNPYDWVSNDYTITILRPETDGTLTANQYKLPEWSEFLTKPILYSGTQNDDIRYDAVITVIQTCIKSYHQVTRVEVSRSFEQKLFIQTLGENAEEKVVLVQDLLKHADPNDRFLDVRVTPGNQLFLIYGKNVEEAPFDSDKGLFPPPNIHKGAIIYDPITGCIIRHYFSVVKPDSDLAYTYFSSSGSIILDSNMRVFDQVKTKHIATIGTQFKPNSPQLALDGKYVIGLSKDTSSVLVVRTSDGQKKGCLFVHGHATCLKVASDDRTVIVGCSDGRVMILSLILELSDPCREYIDKLPSRKCIKQMSLMKLDLDNICTTTPELVRLSQKLRDKMKTSVRKQPSFQTLTTAVTLTNRANRMKSTACCIQ
ncbi:NACHT and WD repeat domain-containing protein 2-like [Gigantopelta aegis]|uniref:NACHT and WD repeat domain-containing protein 2-like n=1 Tax=Gigantopelta aegis TaxID=1735272 RepID=UPI001B88A1BE|nr:NACHT and WD repeat domain-containing protein 2-like [Gigantopelta aegis]